MRTCPNCKTYINDGEQYCPTCGCQPANMEGTATPRRTARIQCPHCGESQALKSSIVTVGKTTRTYWMCHTCRNKFRDRKDLEKELHAMKNPIATLIVNAICAIFGLVLIGIGSARLGEYERLDYFTKMANEGFKTSCWFIVILGIVLLVVGLFSAMVYARKYAGLMQEKKELESKPNLRNMV